MWRLRSDTRQLVIDSQAEIQSLVMCLHLAEFRRENVGFRRLLFVAVRDEGRGGFALNELFYAMEQSPGLRQAVKYQGR